MKATKIMPCPCGKGDYAACCEPLHAGKPAASAEALMRSRYSAYVLRLTSYVQATWHVSTRPPDLALEEDHQTKWLGLEISRHLQQDDTATVEFVARYKVGGRAHRLHEISRFVREQGRWYYVDGEISGP
jgi:SEC-C motif-containing protein